MGSPAENKAYVLSSIEGRINGLLEDKLEVAVDRVAVRVAPEEGSAGPSGPLAVRFDLWRLSDFSDLDPYLAGGDYRQHNYRFGATPYVFHDLLRVANGRAAEHWDVMVLA